MAVWLFVLKGITVTQTLIYPLPLPVAATSPRENMWLLTKNNKLKRCPYNRMFIGMIDPMMIYKLNSKPLFTMPSALNFFQRFLLCFRYARPCKNEKYNAVEHKQPECIGTSQVFQQPGRKLCNKQYTCP